MHFLSLAAFALGMGMGVSIASPVRPGPHPARALHEKREASAHWIARTRAAPEIMVPVRIGLAQPNVHLAHDLLMDIADPRSDKYGQHMTAEEVGELFRPSGESITKVREWLHDSGIDAERHEISAGRSWLKFDATVAELESLLATEYHVFHYTQTGEEHLGCHEYHLPQHIQEHIDLITPAVSMTKFKRDEQVKKRAAPKVSSPAAPKTHFTPASMVHDSLVANIDFPCSVAVTPDCIRQLYGVPNNTLAHAGNEIGIFESGEPYYQEDLDSLFELVAPYIPKGTYPIVYSIDGGLALEDGLVGPEADLDLSIAIPLVYPQKAVFFAVDDEKEIELARGFGDTFLDALDASYCTFEGGDDPTLDPQYPDTGPNPEPGLSNGTWGKPEMCGAYKPTNVITVSYGVAEYQYSFFYENRQCLEFLKLGLQGVTVVYASGDYGVAGNGICLAPANVTDEAQLAQYPGAFSPGFPASCPYVTAVGATMLNSTTGLGETAVAWPEYQFYSGGGFSNYWPAPDYQKEALSSYFKNSPPPYGDTVYGTPFYNKSGRGFPDLAAIGINFFMYLGGEPNFAAGTSAAAPLVASMINIINEHRLAAHKRPVGFINPTIYQNPHIFNDITTGNNPGCNTNGFDAVKGWDPVTGLGTPNFPKLLEVFMAMP
ncbi:hypothetical protein B7463_g6918, partial [Scytalidium lignicola]